MKILLLVLATLPVLARAADHYTEGYNARGRPRAAYTTFARVHGVDVLRPSRELTDFMLDAPLEDSQKAWPVALVLSKSENDLLRRGVVQRARVIKEFLYDVLAGDQRIFATLSPVEKATLRYAFDAGGISFEFLRGVYAGAAKSKFRFLYGPDIIRDASGRFVVLEDNVGAPGGFGDVDFLRRRYLEKSKASFPRVDMLGDVLDSFMDEVGAGVRDGVALLEQSSANLSHADGERERLIQAFKWHGVRVKKFESALDMSMIRAGNKRLIFVLEDYTHLSVRANVAFAEAAAGSDKEFFITPGLEGASSKAFLPMMDRFAEFYLGEELILKSPPTAAIEKLEDIDAFIQKCGTEIVIKQNNGQGGGEVHFANRMNDAQVRALATKIDDFRHSLRLSHGHEIPYFVMQPVVSSSRLTFGDGAQGLTARIDLRPITYVGPERILPPTLPWGRAVTDFGNPRHNVSQGAMQLVVLAACEESLVTANGD